MFEMSHPTIEERDVVELYVLGRLPAEEAERFEDHYLDCRECQAALEREELLARGMKRLAAEEAVATVAVTTAAVTTAWWRRYAMWASLGAALLIAVAMLPLLRPATSDRGEAIANLPVIYLQAERSGPDEAPGHRLHRPAQDGPVVLVFELDPPFYPSYRATVTHDSATVWSGGGLELAVRDTLNLSLPSSVLEPGDHQIVLEGILESGRTVMAGRFGLRVLDLE